METLSSDLQSEQPALGLLLCLCSPYGCSALVCRIFYRDGAVPVSRDVSCQVLCKQTAHLGFGQPDSWEVYFSYTYREHRQELPSDLQAPFLLEN